MSQAHPVNIGILYLSSGAGLPVALLVRVARAHLAPVPALHPHIAYLGRRDLPWFVDVAAIAAAVSLCVELGTRFGLIGFHEPQS